MAIAVDNDILILLVHVLASPLPDHDWFLQTSCNHVASAVLSHGLCYNELHLQELQ